eukprot:c3072_g1_i1.p1 GENE.c3072_g1_i1~~c3072_g1_i1.p1  ORF type:complete len:155 (-),score=31.31 c3072_g1_i1:103-516(-)
MRSLFVVLCLACVFLASCEKIQEKLIPREHKKVDLAALTRLAEFPTSIFLQEEVMTTNKQQPQLRLQQSQQPSGFNFPLNWNPYMATMMHPMQLGNHMMGMGMGGMPFPYAGYYPYLNPYPFMPQPQTPPSPVGDPI